MTHDKLNFTSDDFFIKKISHACMGEEDDSNTGGGNAGSQSDAQASENDNQGGGFGGNKDGGGSKTFNATSSNSTKKTENTLSFEDNDSAMAALGAMQAAALQSDAQTFENLAVASNQAQVDVEGLVGELNDTTQQLLAQSVETNINMGIQPRELEGAAAFWSRVGEFFTPATFTGIKNQNTLAGGIDVGLNISDLIGVPGDSLVELATGKGIFEHAFGDTDLSLSGSGAKTGVGSQSANGKDRTNRTEGGGDDKNKFQDALGLSDKKRDKSKKQGQEPEETAVQKFNSLMDEALRQQLESKIFEMPEFQLLSQINSSNEGST